MQKQERELENRVAQHQHLFLTLSCRSQQYYIYLLVEIMLVNRTKKEKSARWKPCLLSFFSFLEKKQEVKCLNQTNELPSTILKYERPG